MDALRVLIVDDEEDLVTALVERLNLRGFRAEGVTTGTDALTHLARASCDVVLLDVKMPGLGGLEVIKRIKQQQPSPAVVLLTGLGSSQDAERGMALGAFDYLMKPVKIDHLVRVLTAAAARTRAQPAGDHP
jgi:two-component system OmpR family response regulator